MRIATFFAVAADAVTMDVLNAGAGTAKVAVTDDFAAFSARAGAEAEALGGYLAAALQTSAAPEKRSTSLRSAFPSFPSVPSLPVSRRVPRPSARECRTNIYIYVYIYTHRHTLYIYTFYMYRGGGGLPSYCEH